MEAGARDVGVPDLVCVCVRACACVCKCVCVCAQVCLVWTHLYPAVFHRRENDFCPCCRSPYYVVDVHKGLGGHVCVRNFVCMYMRLIVRLYIRCVCLLVCLLCVCVRRGTHADAYALLLSKA